MDSEKSELHKLYGKLDAVVAHAGPQGCWTLERSPAGWVVLLGRQESKGATPEEACSVMLAAVLNEAELRVQQCEDAAKRARDRAAELRTLVAR